MNPVKRRVYDETDLDADNDERMVRALGLIRNIVAGILNDGNVDINIPERLREQMRAEASGVEKMIRQSSASAERIEKMHGTITRRWQGSLQVKNTLLAMLERNLKVARTELPPLEETLGVVRLASKLIEDARYEASAENYWNNQYPVVELRIGQYPWSR